MVQKLLNINEHDLIYYYRQGKLNILETIYLVIISLAANFLGRIAQTMIFHVVCNTLNFSNWYEIDYIKLLSLFKLVLLILSLLKSITVYH